MDTVELIWDQLDAGVSNRVPWRAESTQVFIPPITTPAWFHQLVPSSLVEGVLSVH